MHAEGSGATPEGPWPCRWRARITQRRRIGELEQPAPADLLGRRAEEVDAVRLSPLHVVEEVLIEHTGAGERPTKGSPR